MTKVDYSVRCADETKTRQLFADYAERCPDRDWPVFCCVRRAMEACYAEAPTIEKVKAVGDALTGLPQERVRYDRMISALIKAKVLRRRGKLVEVNY